MKTVGERGLREKNEGGRINYQDVRLHEDEGRNRKGGEGRIEHRKDIRKE